MTLHLEVDLAGGRLRLGGHHLDALLSGLGSPFASGSADLGDPQLAGAWSELAEAGVVSAAGVPAAVFADGFATLVAPWLVVHAFAVGAGGETAHHLWIGPTIGLAAAHVRDGWYDLIPVAPAGTAAALVRLCSLGPRRPLAPGTSTVQPDVLDALVTGRATRTPTGAASAGAVPERDQATATLAEGLALWPEVAASVRSGDWRLVGVDTDWAPGLFADPAAAATASQALLVLDTPAGVLLLDPSGDQVAIHATSPTDVWQFLVALTRPPAGIDPASPLVRRS